MKLFSAVSEDQPAWKVILTGAAIPGIILGFCTLFAIILSFARGWDTQSSIGVGVTVGFFFSFYGGLQVMGAIIFQSKGYRSNLFLALGYIIIWAGCLGLIFKIFG